MGKKPPRPGTSDPAWNDMIERYVRDALKETGTARPLPAPRDRFARASEAPLIRAAEPAPAAAVEPTIAVQDAAELACELERAMSLAMPGALSGIAPAEFVDESPTDTCDPPIHVPAEDEETGVYARPR